MKQYPPDETRLDKDYTYQPPCHPGQVEKYQEVRDRFRAHAGFLMSMCPPSRELSVALTQLELANFAANAAIARHETAADYD